MAWPEPKPWSPVQTGAGLGTSFGPFTIVRGLASTSFGERFLALHDRERTTHTLHRIDCGHARVRQRRVLMALDALAGLSHPHLIPIEEYSLASTGHAVAATPYAGNHDGLMTLGMHLELKGGRLSARETHRALSQLLGALAHAQARGLANGPVTFAQVLVDPRGRLVIDAYGLEHRLRGEVEGTDAFVRDASSVAALGFQMVTGCRPRRTRAGALLAARAIVPGLSEAWDRFFAWSLETPADAAGLLARLPAE